MPLRRYEVRNEYSLADPELYRAADKDDPEALLEGVAMAGLVGVLRQLGDLAEFAAEIFHNLHEEVMATSARGHGLTLRVQQLEAEFPSIEKAFLSQTSHSLFLHNSGFGWHPNLRLDHSLITQGDLPRFVMDSYEECRGPPRLFLLDKFDVAGAGACLKRYTDPSFFKAEFSTSEVGKEDLIKEKKARKVKKKGSRWRTGDTPEISASHSKLHQLLLEERCQSQDNVLTHRVKLKRRHSSKTLVKSTSGKSYMERILNGHSPDSRFLSGSYAIPSCLTMRSNNISGLVPEREIPEMSPAYKLVTRDISPTPSHSRDEKELKSSLDEFGLDIIVERNSNKLLEEAPEIELVSIPPTLDKAEDKTKLVIDSKGNTETGAEGYHSDAANSEIDNYTDALTTMDSELETDTESKPKNEQSSKIERKCVDTETNEEQTELQAQFLDSESIGSSIVSEDGNDSLEKGSFSSSYSDTFSNSGEILPSDGDLADKAHPSIIAKNVDASSKKTHEIRNASVTRTPEHAVPKGSCNEVSAVRSYSSDSREASCGSDVVDSVTGQLSPKSENGGSAGRNLSSITNVSDIPSHSKYDALSVRSHKNRNVGMFQGGNLDACCDISKDLFNILDPAHEEKDVDEVFAATLTTGGAHDSHNENQMIGNLDSPDSVLLNTETELYGLAQKDLKEEPISIGATECRLDSHTDGDINEVRHDGTVVDLEEVTPSGEKSEYLTSMVTCLETDAFIEPKDVKITDMPVSLELHRAEVGIDDSEVEASRNNLEYTLSDCSGSKTANNMECDMSDNEVKDGHAPDRVHLDSSINERKSDISLKLPFECTISDTKSVSAAEASLQEVDSETINICSKDVDDTLVYGIPIGSTSSDGYVNQNTQDILEATAATIFTRSKAEKEVENGPIAVPLDYNVKLCNLEENNPSSLEFLDETHDPLMPECTQTHLNLTEYTEIPSSKKESDQKKELKQPLESANAKETLSPSTISLEAAALLEGQELHGIEDNLWSLQKNGESRISLYHQYELAESPNHMDSDGCSIAPSKSSSMDPLRLSPTTSYEFEISEPSVFPLQPICHGCGLHPDASNQHLLDQQPHRPILDISLPDNNAVQEGVEEMPPLPPLPPMQWRIGKFQHDSPTSRGEMALFNESSPLSAETADWIGQQGYPTFHGPLSQPLNPFIQHPTSEVNNPQHGLQMLGSEVVQPSLSSPFLVVPAVEYHNVQMDHPILESTVSKPLNPSTVTDGDFQHASSHSGDEMSQLTSLNPFTPVPPTEDLNTRCVSLNSHKGLEFLNSLAPIKHGEDEKLHYTFLDLESKVMQSQASTTPATIDEKLELDSQILDGELKWQSNSPAVIPAVDNGKPNGSFKSRLSRPRDPLIEAVASHDKSNLRKVAERIIPQIGPQVDERNSLLEQIRAKSFNLKPAVATRPSIHGPKTNLKVVAILEKANAIRQALAGSDEDADDDSWSDS